MLLIFHSPASILVMGEKFRLRNQGTWSCLRCSTTQSLGVPNFDSSAMSERTHCQCWGLRWCTPALRPQSVGSPRNPPASQLQFGRFFRVTESDRMQCFERKKTEILLECQASQDYYRLHLRCPNKSKTHGHVFQFPLSSKPLATVCLNTATKPIAISQGRNEQEPRSREC